MTRHSIPTTILLLALVAILAVVAALAQQPQPPSLTAAEILDRVRGTWRGESFHATVRLEVTLGGQTKVHVLEVWTLGDDYALLRVLEPVDDAGSGYLQIGDELWYASPQVGEAIKLPSLAIGDALFGSGPSIEDLSLGTLSDDYEATAETIGSDGDVGGYFLTLVPHADAPVVYGKLELTVSADFAVERLVTYDQRGEVLQTSTFSDLIDVNGQKLPMRIVIEDAYGDRTVQQITNPEYNLGIDASFFTLARLEGTQ